MPPSYDINDTYENALNMVKGVLQKCDEKFGNDAGGDKITNKLYTILYIIGKCKYGIDGRFYEDYKNDMLFIVYNLGLITGIISSYLQNNNLTKDQMIELNKIYRKYKNETK